MRIILSHVVLAVLLFSAPGVLPAQTIGQESRTMQAVVADPVFGGLPTGQPTGDTLDLSLEGALERGLKYNLAGILGEQGIRATEAARQRTRSQLLPTLGAGVSESQLQVNLRALGFGGFSGVGYMVGPFGVFDSRLVLSQSILDLKAIHENRAGRQRLEAVELTYRSIRDRIVVVCGDLYFQAIAGQSRITASEAQLKTAQELYDLAVDRNQAGVVPGIEVLRAQVELQAQQQRLIVAQNEFEQEKLSLARAVGLPLGQRFRLADSVPYAALRPMTLDEAVQRAYRDRADYQSGLALVRAAESARKAAQAERLPTVSFNAHYGVNGPSPAEIHGNYSLIASLRIPIFEGGRAEARVLEADAAWRQRQAELEDLRGRIYYEVQTAFLNLQAADDRVRVAGSAVKLAEEQVVQAQDRFGAGVASNIEVVQAQQALAGATETYIASLYAHNSAKGRLSQVLGAAESSFLQFMRGN